MPIYEFECEGCGTRFDELAAALSIGAACPKCGSRRTRRLLSNVSPPSRQPRGPGVRESESKRREREAARSERAAKTKRKPASGEM